MPYCPFGSLFGGGNGNVARGSDSEQYRIDRLIFTLSAEAGGTETGRRLSEQRNYVATSVASIASSWRRVEHPNAAESRKTLQKGWQPEVVALRS
jgi:hypothetical protein